MLNRPIQSTVRLLLCETDEGVYLFTYDRTQDAPATADYWFETVDDAMGYANSNYGVRKDSWSDVPDQIEGCQMDILAPVRVKGRDTGNPQWGQYEILQNGLWVEHSFT